MGGFAWGFLKMYVFSLIFLNVLGDVDHTKSSQVGYVQESKEILLFSLFLVLLSFCLVIMIAKNIPMLCDKGC